MAAAAIGILLGIVLGILLLLLLIHRRRRKSRMTKCLKSAVLLGSDEAEYLDVEESLGGGPRTPHQPRLDRYKVPIDQPHKLDWLCLAPSPSTKTPLSASNPPQLFEMHCRGTIDDDFEATFVTRCHSDNVSGVEDDSQSYAVCLRRTCGSYAHPSNLTSPYISHAYPCLSPTSRSSQEHASFFHTPCINHAHTGPALAAHHVHLGNSTTNCGSHAQSVHAPIPRDGHTRPRLATTCLSHAQIPPLDPKSQNRYPVSGSHAHSGAVSTACVSPNRPITTCSRTNPGNVPAPCGSPAHPPLLQNISHKSPQISRNSGPNTPGVHSQPNKEKIVRTTSSSAAVETSNEELNVKANQTFTLLSKHTDSAVVVIGAVVDGCPDLVQNSNSLTKKA